MYKLKPWLRFLEGDEGGAGSDSGTGDEDGQGSSDDAGGQITDEDGNVDWKAAARKHEREAKTARKRAEENEAAAQRLADLEEADKSESQKATDRAAAAEKRAEAAELDAQRYRLAVTYQLTDEQADLFLNAPDAELMEEQAKALSEMNEKSTREPARSPAGGRKPGAEKGSVSAGRDRWAEKHTSNT